MAGRGSKTTTATLSSKYQIGIPKAVREQLKLHAGQQFTVLARGESIVLVPKRSLDDLRGRLRGADVTGVRDRQARTSDAHFEHLPGVQYLRPATRAAT